MKKTLLLTLMTVSFMTTAQAGIFGTVDKYIIQKTGQVIEVSSNDISKDGIVKFFDYKEHKKKTIELSELSKSTINEIAGVKAGEVILLTTGAANSSTETVSRVCQVFNVFESKQAHVGCKTYEEDNKNGAIATNRLDFIVNNVESVVAEVKSSEGLSKGEKAELRIDTRSAKAGRNVKVLAIFANGEVLVQKFGFNILDTNSIIHQSSVDRVTLSDLNKL